MIYALYHVPAFVIIYTPNTIFLHLKLPKKKPVEFANSVDPDEVAHYEPPHPNLYSLPSSL